MEKERITTLDLSLAHAEWKAQETQHIQALKLWGVWFREMDGPAKWREHIDMIRGNR